MTHLIMSPPFIKQESEVEQLSISVKLATFSKRENSTAQYSGTWIEYNCVLKEGCSVINPRIELQVNSDIHSFNYAYISAFSRYYFIRDFTYYRDSVVLTLECDVLATYKSDIGSSSEYVLRSASSYDGTITDSLYPVKAQTTFQVGSTSAGGTPGSQTIGTFEKSEMCFVIGILNNTQTNKFGAVKYYVLNSTALGDLMNFLLGQDLTNSSIAQTDNILDFIHTNFSTWETELQNGIVRSLMNPTDYIVESYALPYTPDVGTAETLRIAWWPTTVSGRPIVSTDQFTKGIHSGSLTINKHPQSSSRGDYMNLSPYTRYWLYLGVFGYYPLDTMKVLNATKVDFHIYGDAFGNVKCQLSVDGIIIDTLSANVKCNFPIGQVSVDALGGSSAMLSAVSPLVGVDVEKGDIPNSLINGASGVVSATRALLPQARVSGSTGTFVDVFTSFISYCEFHEVVSDDLTHRGRPLCQQKTISTLSGYILVSDADISVTGTKEENEQIKNYMNSGFYYE